VILDFEVISLSYSQLVSSLLQDKHRLERTRRSVRCMTVTFRLVYLARIQYETHNSLRLAGSAFLQSAPSITSPERSARDKAEESDLFASANTKAKVFLHPSRESCAREPQPRLA